MTKEKNQDFQLETMYQEYLKKTGLLGKMRTIQAIETKRAFYGGVASILITLERDVSEIEDDEQGAKVLESLLQQCKDFWKKESGS